MKVLFGLVLVLASIQTLVSADFHHRKLNQHISFKHKNKVRETENKDGVVTGLATRQPVPTKYGPFYMNMPLDHFNNGTSTFKNKYWVNRDYYKTNGPVILYNVGEAAADTSDYLVLQSTMAQLAEYLNGIVIIMEHRFYGTSGPVVKTFFDHTKEDLQTFNAKQAVADMAYLVKNIKFQSIRLPPIPQTKVVVYGCSYSGNLAAWARETYPEIFYAGVASSAPVEASVNFYQYFDPIIRYGPKACITAMENAISYIDNILFHGTNAQVKALKTMFHAENLVDQSFAELLMGDFSGDWQYGINSTYNAFANQVCGYFPTANLKNDTRTAKQNVKAYSNYINDFTKENYCNGDEQVLEDCLHESNFTIINDVSQVSDNEAAWTWQTCVEFGYFQVASPKGLPTIISRKYGLNYYANMCKQYFGKYNIPTWPDVKDTNAEFGGYNVQLNKTIWIDGEWDSWRELSVNNLGLNRQFGPADESLSIIIPKSTHCSNVRMVTNGSPQYLKDAFTQQYRTLKAWLTAK